VWSAHLPHEAWHVHPLMSKYGNRNQSFNVPWTKFPHGIRFQAIFITVCTKPTAGPPSCSQCSLCLNRSHVQFTIFPSTPTSLKRFLSFVFNSNFHMRATCPAHPHFVHMLPIWLSLSRSRNLPPLWNRKLYSLQWLQEPATGLYPEPAESSPDLHALFL
jgi:hypothetical protein